MQCAITIGLTKRKLLAAVPPRYRPKLPPLRASLYTMLKFRSAREDVVLSRVVQDALSRIEGNDHLVAIGGSFTMEALDLLQARGAVVLQLSEFCWTDERYLAIRGGRTSR